MHLGTLANILIFYLIYLYHKLIYLYFLNYNETHIVYNFYAFIFSIIKTHITT